MSENYTPHIVATTLADEPLPDVLTVMACDPAHAIVRAIAHINPEFHASILRVAVDAKR